MMVNGEREELRLVRRRANQKSGLKIGRTMTGKREQLEKASERLAAREKLKKKKAARVWLTVLGLVLVGLGLGYLILTVFYGEREVETEALVVVPREPTVEIIDEDNGGVTARMKEYIGQVEQDFLDLGYKPVKVVVPRGAIREVDVYLDGYQGFMKLTLDRGAAESVEDADRMMRYLKGKGVDDFSYVDVRIERKGYWKP